MAWRAVGLLAFPDRPLFWELPLKSDPNNLEQLTANVLGRRKAEDALTVAEELLTELPPLAHSRFWETLAAYTMQKCGWTPENKLAVRPAPLTYDEAIAFEQQIVPFGKYAGQRVGDVPATYWTYITEGDFNRNLSRYLASDHFRSRED